MDEEQELDSSHDWGERDFHDGDGRRVIPVCLDCRVDGFINEPKAFKRCPGTKRSQCPVKMESLDDPGHQHRCVGGHPADGDHLCKECRRWYNVRPDSPLAVS